MSTTGKITIRRSRWLLFAEQMTVNEIVKKYKKTAAVFTKHRVDSCCGGAVSLAVAAKRDGADLKQLIADLEAVIDD